MTQQTKVTPIELYNPVKFLVYRNAAQNTGSGAFAVINFDTKVYDTGTNVDVVTNKGRFTAPYAGWYDFDATANITTTAKDLLMTLYVNGVGYAYGTRGQASSNQGVSISIPIQLAANDYVEIFTFCSATAAYDVGTAPIKTWFAGELRSNT